MPLNLPHAPPLPEWNKGLFALELLEKKLLPRDLSNEKNDAGEKRLITLPQSRSEPPLAEGTWDGTKMAASEIFHRILQRYGSFFDVANFESTIPQAFSQDEKLDLFQFQAKDSDNYPPHLALIPPAYQTSLLKIFDGMRLLDTASLLIRLVPLRIHGSPIRPTIAGIEQEYRVLRSQKKDIFAEETIGDHPNWYSDAVFAQSQFTGTNPTTIKLAANWIQQFQQEATSQSNQRVAQLLQSADPNTLYVQDNSYFREAVKAAPTDTLKSANTDKTRYACASVSLFQLHPDGLLHPLAIVLDYKDSMANSVCIFNKRLRAGDPTASEAGDWPWRYAKNCAMVSDWLRHELTIHLTNTHLVEEAVIVAAHRSFKHDHPVFRLLEPHWLKTLSLNAAARAILVPQVIVNIVGFTDTQLYAFVKHAYTTFDFQGLMIPNDLETRGFPEDKLHSDATFRNYAYGKNMSLMWDAIHTFVGQVIAESYTSDAQVANDEAIQHWVSEMQDPNAADLQSFPTIHTVEDLVDAITMCVHIASPQHTAVNYLQGFYQSFVISKPPALCAPLPSSIAELQEFTEDDMMKALPVDRPREWLLASHLPYLLSMRVAEDQNLMNYAASLANLAKQHGEAGTEKAATDFYNRLVQLIAEFKKHSDSMTPGTIPYNVMDPDATAVSILI